jgi:K+-sensing histidine kinase KdpD
MPAMAEAENPADPGVVARIVADVHEAHADRTLATAELVLEITTAAAGEYELDGILRAGLDRLRGIVAFTGGSIALVDGDELVVRAAVGPFEDEAIGQRVRRNDGRSWSVVTSRESIRVDDVQAEGVRMRGKRAANSMRSWLAVPIPRRGEGIGLLEVDSTTPGAFSAEDETLVATVGRALAGPVDLAARYASDRRARELRDAFTGVISHELRTPITTIYGMSQVLRQRHTTMDPEALRQVIEDIEGEADRLRRLAEDLLVLSRTEGGRLQMTTDPLLLGHVVRRRIADESAHWPRHRFNATIPLGLPLVLGEEMYVEQVVQNLLNNAAKYSPAGSEVSVIVEPVGGEIVVRVLDEGIGLSDESPDTLFELFYRSAHAARQASGAGIGLFVCRQLIESMGGRIWARRRETAGSEFGFALPVHAEVDADDEPD